MAELSFTLLSSFVMTRAEYQTNLALAVHLRNGLCLMMSFTMFSLLFQTNGHSTVGGDLVYQERLSRLESDKECLVLQVTT